MDLETVREIYARHVNHWMNLPGVNATGIGLHSDSGDLCIAIWTKSDQDHLTLALPTTVDGVRIEHRTGNFMTAPHRNSSAKPRETDAGANPRDKEVEPMIGGISVNPNYITSTGMGTLGIALNHRTHGTVILSNHHVICRSDPSIDDEVAQPAHEILFHLAAHLKQWYIGTEPLSEHGMDAAIAKPTNGRSATLGTIFGFDGIYSTTAAPTLNMKVEKSGLTTAVTRGTVRYIHVNICNDDKIEFKNQVMIENDGGIKFADHGDSGSVVVDNAATPNSVVALLWGAYEDKSKGIKFTIASPITPILTHFECTLT